jgi:hypothetical protein
VNGAHVDDLIDGLLLRALEPNEEALVRKHVGECASCARALVESREILAVLPGSLDDLSPRPSLRVALLAAAARDAADATPIRDESRPARLLPFRMDKRSSNPFLRWASLGMAAAFIIGLVGGVTGWALLLGDRLGRKAGDLEKSGDNIEKLLKSDHIVTISSTFEGSDIRALLAVPASGPDAFVVVQGVPTATAGNGYHIWLFANGVAESGGVVVPDSDGDIVTTLDADLSKYDRIEPDLQPVSGSSPGGDVVIASELPKP